VQHAKIRFKVEIAMPMATIKIKMNTARTRTNAMAERKSEKKINKLCGSELFPGGDSIVNKKKAARRKRRARE
jgi:hypothetical protein